jgi:hypothetical protein
MRLFWQYLQAYWRPLIGTFVQQPAALSAPDLPVAALGMHGNRLNHGLKASEIFIQTIEQIRLGKKYKRNHKVKQKKFHFAYKTVC